MDEITAVTSTLGVSGALVWFLYYNTSVLIPKRDEIYTASIREISQEFTRSLREEREFRRAEMSELKALIKEHYAHHEQDHDHDHNRRTG